MPRKAKTQTPQSPGLEAGSAYGEVQENISAQKEIPLPQTRDTNMSASVETPQQGLPVEAAKQFIPEITPLLSASDGVRRPEFTINPMSENQIAQNILQSWADSTGDPATAAAAMQMQGQ
jgi:hypothetical protein